MREILFRGKTISGEWVEGLLARKGSQYYISNRAGSPYAYEVFLETVGQYTGTKDKNDKMIFEGDIVSNEWCFIKGNSIVKCGVYKECDMPGDYQCGHCGFYLDHSPKENDYGTRHDLMFYAGKCEIISNIYDNPELLER